MYTRLTRGYLPHLVGSQATYFLTFRLEDSLPTVLLLRWKHELAFKKSLQKNNSEAIADLEHEYYRQIEAYLDSNTGQCWLKEERIAGVVADALRHFHQQRYLLHAWTIMPNHVHALVTILNPFQLASVVHSWKSFTAHQANKILGRSGRFWQNEYFDRLIKSPKQFALCVRYVLNNPIKAGLCKGINDWPWLGYSQDVEYLVRRFF